MTQEDKDLLLKDLCSRLPYNLMVEYKGETYNVLGITHGRLVLCKPFMSYTLDEHPLVQEVKPYLFPLSSMTDEQNEEYESLCIKNTSECTDLYDIIFSNDYYDTIESVDYLYKNHIDIRGLIPMGLAINATNLNIY